MQQAPASMDEDEKHSEGTQAIPAQKKERGTQRTGLQNFAYWEQEAQCETFFAWLPEELHSKHAARLRQIPWSPSTRSSVNSFVFANSSQNVSYWHAARHAARLKQERPPSLPFSAYRSPPRRQPGCENYLRSPNPGTRGDHALHFVGQA